MENNIKVLILKVRPIIIFYKMKNNSKKESL